jgi:FkbM family methyltransferase
MSSFLTQFALYIASRPRIPLSLRRHFASACIPLDGRPFQIQIDGRPFAGSLDNYIEWVVYVTRRHFEYTYLNLLRQLMAGGGVAMDVGANVGNHTHAFSPMFKHVHSFEPFERVADRLQDKANLLPNVTVHRVALSDRTDTLRFEQPKTANWGKGRITQDGDIQVPVFIGDDYIKAHIAQSIDFIKIDVEGHELPVLRGLRGTIQRDRPVIMFEVPKALKKVDGGDWPETMNLFPQDYSFVCFSGQSTFPIQTDVAHVQTIDRATRQLPRRATYILAYGPERGFMIQKRHLLPGPVRSLGGQKRGDM